MKYPQLNRAIRRALKFQGQVDVVDPALLDNVGIGAQLEAKPLHRMNFNVKIKIDATCTVIKNKGRSDERVICVKKHNVLRNGGRDHIHDLMFENAATSAAGHRSINHIGLSTDATAPSATTAVGTTTGLITDSGLAAAEATTRSDSGYTSNFCTITLSKTFVATAAKDDIQKTYLMSRVPSTGTFTSWIVAHEVTFPDTDVGVGDSLTLTWTITMSRQHGNLTISMINDVGSGSGGLRELVGRIYTDLQSGQSSGSAQFGINNIGLSDSDAAIDDTVTALPGLIAGRGLGRTNATVAHTAGTNITTVTHTFQLLNNAAATTIRKSGLYTSSTSGHSNLYFYGNFAEVRILQPNDSITVTWTMTVSGT